MVFAAREGAWENIRTAGLVETQLTGLEPDAARALLDVHLDDAPAEEVTRRLIIGTRGNPLALWELPGELTTAQLRGSESLPRSTRITGPLALIQRANRP